MADPAPGKLEADRAGWFVRDYFPSGVAPMSKVLFDGAGTGTGIDFGSSSFTTGIALNAACASYGINISGVTPTGIYVSGTTTNALLAEVDTVSANNSKIGINISKDLTNATAAGALSSTNQAINIASANASSAAASGVLTVSSGLITASQANSTAVAQADVYSATLFALTYSATTTTAGTATSSAKGISIDYDLTETAGTLSVDDFSIFDIDFDTTGTVSYLAGTYNAINVNMADAGVPAHATSTVFNGLQIDASGLDVSDSDMTLSGIKLTMPGTYGAGAEYALYASGDGTTVALCSDGAVGVSVGGTVTIGLEIPAGATSATGIAIADACSAAGVSITGACATGISITGACATAAVTIGASGTTAGDLVWYGTTTSYAVTFDANGDTNGSVLIGADTKGLMFNLYGDTTGCGVFWDPTTDTNGTLSIGAATGSKGNDLKVYGNTTGNYLHWDQSGDDLLLVGTGTQLSIAGDTDSSGVSTGSLNTAGGLGVAKKSFFGDDMSIATSKKITTAAELTLNSVDPLTIQIGGVDWLQMDEAAVATFAAATDTVGHSVYFETEDGGVDGGTTSAGKAGGLYSFKTGDGSAAVTGGAVGGAGGALSLITGVGNTGETAGNGGVGGAFNITAGAGGASGTGVGVGGTGGTITLTAGAGGAIGGGTVGAPGKVKLGAGLLHQTNAQSITMGDNSVTTTLVPGTPTGTLLTSNVLWVDAESTGTENLILPPEADCNGLVLYIYNFGGEAVVVQDDTPATVDTVATTEIGVFFCNGSSWEGANIA